MQLRTHNTSDLADACTADVYYCHVVRTVFDQVKRIGQVLSERMGMNTASLEEVGLFTPTPDPLSVLRYVMSSSMPNRPPLESQEHALAAQSNLLPSASSSQVCSWQRPMRKIIARLLSEGQAPRRLENERTVSTLVLKHR